MGDEITISWEEVKCGGDSIGVWVGRLIRPIRSVPFVKVVQSLDGHWTLWYGCQGISVHAPVRAVRYGRDLAKPMADAERWARSRWRTIPTS